MNKSICDECRKITGKKGKCPAERKTTCHFHPVKKRKRR
jgi:hypothetical protein